MGQMNWGDYAEEAAKSGGFEPLPIGTYNVRVDAADVKDAKNDHKAILTKLVVTDGPLAGRSTLNNMAPYKNDGDPNGFFTSALAALGFGQQQNPAFWQQLGAMPTEEQGIAFVANSILGAEATIEINHRSFGGVMRDNVKKITPKGAALGNAPGVPPIAVVPGAVPVPPAPVAAPVTVNVAATPAVVPVAPANAAVPQAAPVAAAPQAIAPAPVAAAPAPVAAAVAPVEVAPAPVAAVPPVLTPVVPVAAPVPVPVPVAGEMPRPDGAPF